MNVVVVWLDVSCKWNGFLCVLSSIGKVEFDIFDVLSLKTGPMITNHCIKRQCCNFVR